MAGKRERVLFAVFAALCSAAAVFIAVSLYMEKVERLDARISSYHTQIERMKSKTPATPDPVITGEDLEIRIREAASRYYEPGETDLYRFGLEMEKLLSLYGIRIDSCRSVLGAGSRYLEYRLQGDALSFMHYLERLSKGKKAVSIKELSIQSTADGDLKIMQKAGYEEIDLNTF